MCKDQIGEVANEVLMLAFQTGDNRAFNELYRRHERWVFHFVFGKVGNRADAEDISQEVWMRVTRRRDLYRPEKDRFNGWLKQIAGNLFIDHYRSCRVKFGAVDFEQMSARKQDPTDAIMASEVLAALPASQRDVLLLNEYYEYTLEEIAPIVGAGMETCKSRLRYARAKAGRLAG